MWIGNTRPFSTASGSERRSVCCAHLYTWYTKVWIGNTRPFSTASGSERRSVSGSVLEPRSLPLAVLIASSGSWCAAHIVDEEDAEIPPMEIHTRQVKTHHREPDGNPPDGSRGIVQVQPTHPPTCNLNPPDGSRGIVQIQPVAPMSHLTLILAHMDGNRWMVQVQPTQTNPHSLKSHRWKSVDRSSPAFPLTRQVGLERSTTYRWRDSGRPLACACRLDVNDPPPAVGWICAPSLTDKAW
jgi:hypothetical protein